MPIKPKYMVPKVALLMVLFLPGFTDLLSLWQETGDIEQHINRGQNQSTPTSVSAIQNSLAQDWEWIEVPSPIDDQVTSCKFLSANDGWVATFGGSLFHWDGQEWHPYPFETDKVNFFFGLDMISPDDGWVAGYGGSLLHWNGAEWARVASPTERELHAISFVSKDFGFAVGGSEAPHAPDGVRVALRWDGKRWSEVEFPKVAWAGSSQPIIESLVMTSPKEGWAASNGDLYRWDGQSWKPYHDQTDFPKLLFINQFASIAPDNIWAVAFNAEHEKEGYGLIIHWDGTSWKKITTNRVNLTSIHMLSPYLGWATGTLNVAAVDYKKGVGVQDSTIINWDGKQWTFFPLPNIPDVDNVFLSQLCGLDLVHLWIFGATRTGNKDQVLSLRLVKKTLASPTATVAGTVISTITEKPFVLDSVTALPTNPSLPTIEPTKQLPGLRITEKASTGKNELINQMAIPGLGLLIIGFVILFMLLRTKK